MTKQATFIRRVNEDSARAIQKLYQLSEPLDGHEFVVVSAIGPEAKPIDPSHAGTMMMASILGGYGDGNLETFIFGSDENGEVSSWRDLEGSTDGICDHDQALANAGYTVVYALAEGQDD